MWWWHWRCNRNRWHFVVLNIDNGIFIVIIVLFVDLFVLMVATANRQRTCIQEEREIRIRNEWAVIVQRQTADCSGNSLIKIRNKEHFSLATNRLEQCDKEFSNSPTANAKYQMVLIDLRLTWTALRAHLTLISFIIKQFTASAILQFRDWDDNNNNRVK